MNDPLPVFAGECDTRGHIAFDAPRQVVAYCRAKFSGQRVEVEIRPRRGKRSLQQNRLFWSLLVPWAHQLGYEPDALKLKLLGLLWGTETRRSPLTDQVLTVPRKPGTSTLTTTEMSTLIDFMAVKAAETGYLMQLPDKRGAA